MKEWMTLLDCFKKNGSKFPLKVMWRGNASYAIGKPRVLIYVKTNPYPYMKWVLHEDYRTAGAGCEYHVESALTPDFQLIRENYCTCDYRNVILVTGCRCQKQRIDL